MTLIVSFIFLCSFPFLSYANLVLTYPQARFPPLDFLPDDLTLPPCGIPKPTKPFYTTFHIGETYNISWITPLDTNPTYRIRLIDSDGLTVEQLPESGSISYQLITLKSPCEQCMLLVEQTSSIGKVFRTCSDINVIRGDVKDEEKCNQRGSMMNGNTTCQCESGFTGEQCQHYAHCETDDDCLNNGKCVTQMDSLIKKKCYCSYGYFGQRCDQKFNSQNDNCFAYDEPSSSDLPMYGMFNSRCYIRHDLSADDHLYSRQINNEVEVIMDFTTKSFVSLGWRPTQLSTSCRLFPILEDTRGRSNQMDEESKRHFVAKPVMPKNNGYTENGLKSVLHPMDCVDMIIGSVRKGKLFISDYYSRDRSTPLEDYWYEGEMSLSAAYGIEQNGRTIIMFRRELREFEPTDHPLGPNEILVVWAKGDNNQGDEIRYHGTNRGVEKLKLSEVVNVTFEQPATNTNELAFGVKNVIQERLDPMTVSTMPSTTMDKVPQTTTTTKKTTYRTTTTTTTQSTTTTEVSSATKISIFIAFFSFMFF